MSNIKGEEENTLEEIHESLVNGQRRQFVKQVDNYGGYDFWEDYKNYLKNTYVEDKAQLEYFTDATISYFRIKSR